MTWITSQNPRVPKPTTNGTSRLKLDPKGALAKNNIGVFDTGIRNSRVVVMLCHTIVALIKCMKNSKLKTQQSEKSRFLSCQFSTILMIYIFFFPKNQSRVTFDCCTK